ncbi:hypothetical protein QUF63_12235 [Anaerolineales bacterium HSG25]|nr:hypothetical protein [Anaerolineales bacterium HSG25]
MSIINIILTIYIWALSMMIIYFLMAIARFYEKKSKQRSYHQLFIPPMFLFSLATLRYLLIAPTITGDFLGDGLRFIGGVILLGVGLYVLKLMIGERR